jgi:hypothetical protein
MLVVHTKVVCGTLNKAIHNNPLRFVWFKGVFNETYAHLINA